MLEEVERAKARPDPESHALGAAVVAAAYRHGVTVVIDAVEPPTMAELGPAWLERATLDALATSGRPVLNPRAFARRVTSALKADPGDGRWASIARRQPRLALQEGFLEVIRGALVSEDPGLALVAADTYRTLGLDGRCVPAFALARRHADGARAARVALAEEAEEDRKRTESARQNVVEDPPLRMEVFIVALAQPLMYEVILGDGGSERRAMLTSLRTYTSRGWTRILARRTAVWPVTLSAAAGGFVQEWPWFTELTEGELTRLAEDRAWLAGVRAREKARAKRQAQLEAELEVAERRARAALAAKTAEDDRACDPEAPVVAQAPVEESPAEPTVDAPDADPERFRASVRSCRAERRRAPPTPECEAIRRREGGRGRLTEVEVLARQRCAAGGCPAGGPRGEDVDALRRAIVALHAGRATGMAGLEDAGALREQLAQAASSGRFPGFDAAAAKSLLECIPGVLGSNACEEDGCVQFCEVSMYGPEVATATAAQGRRAGAAGGAPDPGSPR